MQSITSETFAMLVMGAWLALGAKLLLNRYSKQAEKKRKAERRALFEARRDERDDKRPTMLEALESELDAYRSIAVRGDDEAQRNNALYARIVMEDDLGRYAEGPRPYADLDQARRDILLAHARKDAAEALATSRTLLLEVRRLTSALDEINRVLFWLFAAYLLWAWWKSGFALWWQ
ncbi:putative membrane protein [Bradyrhizobium sp. USDA 377]